MCCVETGTTNSQQIQWNKNSYLFNISPKKHSNDWSRKDDTNLQSWRVIALSKKVSKRISWKHHPVYNDKDATAHTSFQKGLEVVMLTSFQKAMRFLFQHLKLLCLGAQGQWENFAAALEKFVACVSLVGKLREVSAKQISIFLSEQPFIRN